MSHSKCISLMIDLLLFWFKLLVEGTVWYFLFYVLGFISFLSSYSLVDEHLGRG